MCSQRPFHMITFLGKLDKIRPACSERCPLHLIVCGYATIFPLIKIRLEAGERKIEGGYRGHVYMKDGRAIKICAPDELMGLEHEQDIAETGCFLDLIAAL